MPSPHLRIPPMPELVAPAPLAAAAVLVLNDHWGKQHFPGLVTGKLSDLAGAFVMPLFVSAVLALATRWPLRLRVIIGAASTVGLLAAVKLSSAAAAAVAGTLDLLWRPLALAPGRIVADPTDLLALPLSLAALAFGWSAGERRTASQTSNRDPLQGGAHDE
jgi:threonine dehydrogenase-like Zn-dependent dehydrogenase